jgi:hypothetical protein
MRFKSKKGQALELKDNFLLKEEVVNMKTRDLENLDYINEQSKGYKPSIKAWIGDNFITRCLRNKGRQKAMEKEGYWASEAAQSFQADFMIMRDIFERTDIAALRADIVENPDRAKATAISILRLEDMGAKVTPSDEDKRSLIKGLKDKYKNDFFYGSEEKQEVKPVNKSLK